MLSFVTFSTFITTIIITNCIDSNIFECDGESDSCTQNTINCENGEDCSINCKSDPFDSTNILEESCMINNPGCCDSIIYCPNDAQCNIDCSYSCNGITVHANKSTELIISNCGDNCDGMTIFCPKIKYSQQDTNGDNGDNDDICLLYGNSSIYSLDIYVSNGFDDLSININNKNEGIYSSTIYCQNKDNEIESCDISPFSYNECQESISLFCDIKYIDTTSHPTHSPTASPLHFLNDLVNDTNSSIEIESGEIYANNDDDKKEKETEIG
eukprot:171021_1